MDADPKAMKELEDAVTLQGFLYLDLQASQSSQSLRNVDECVERVLEFYAKPLEDILRYDADKLGMHKLNG